MDLFLAGLAGVVLGAVVACAVFFWLLEHWADRDLIERRIRACAEYTECLGGLGEAFNGSGGDPAMLQQAWSNVAAFCREFRLTGWILEPGLRDRLAAAVEALQKEERLHRATGDDSSGRVAQVLCERFHEVDRLLRTEIERQEKAFRRFRLVPRKSSGGEG